MVIIRGATVADAAGIAVVQRAGWFAAYEGIVPHDIIERVQVPDGGARIRERLRGRPWQSTLVACDEAGEVIGYAAYGPERDVDYGFWPPTLTHAGQAGQIGELYALYVHPGWWSTGTGRALITDVLAKITALGYREVVLWVLEKNARARRFYSLAGFEPDGAINILDGLGGVPEVRYRRTVLPVAAARFPLEARHRGAVPCGHGSVGVKAHAVRGGRTTAVMREKRAKRTQTGTTFTVPKPVILVV